MESASPFDKLPLAMISHIISFLRAKNRRNASLICKTWYKAVNASQLLTSTFIMLEATNKRFSVTCRETVLSGLGKRKVPNLTINFYDEDDRISPDFARHLASGTKHIHLLGEFTACHIMLVIENFPNLKSLKMEPSSFRTWRYLLKVEFLLHKFFLKSLGQLQDLIFESPKSFIGEDLAALMQFLTRANNLSLHVNTILPDEYSGVDFFKLLKGPTVNVQNLRELDMRWVFIHEKEFQEFVNIPDLKRLCSLKYYSWTGGDRNLISLSNSDMTLETLEVECEKDGYYLRYPTISSLLTKKESLRSITCRHIMYKHRAEDSSQPLMDILQEWPNIHRLKIWPADEFHDDYGDVYHKIVVKLKKYVNDHHFITMDIWTPAIVDKQTLLTLGQRSPGLQNVAFGPIVNQIDFSGLCMMADTFSQLTTLCLDENDMAGVDLGALGAPLKEGGSRLANLKSLSLGYCRNMRDETLLGLHFPSLKHLWLTKSTEITDRAVISIASSNPTLELFSVASCSKVTNEGINSIASNLKYLRCLLISECIQLTMDVGFILAEHCHNLEFLDVAGCSESLIERAKPLRGFDDATPFCSRVLDKHDLDVLMKVVQEDDWGSFALDHATKEAVIKFHGL